jgi:hypothetical protein
MTTQTATPITTLIDGQPVPIADCIWLEQRPCGCTTAAVVAVVPDAWTIATAEQAMEHFNPTRRERRLADEAGRTAVAITNARYRADLTGSWTCPQHTR